MKLYPYSSLKTDNKTILIFTRVLGALSILGFYITLLIAGFYYFNLEVQQLSAGETKQSFINNILIQGVSYCFIAFSISALLAWNISYQEKNTAINAS